MDRLPAALYAIAGLVGRTGDPRVAKESILRECVNLFHADAGGIAILDPDINLLRVEVHHGLPPDTGEHTLRLDQGLTGWVALHGKPALVADVAADPRYIRLRSQARCAMAAPLECDGHILGALTLNSDTVAAWTATDLAAFAQLAAEVLELRDVPREPAVQAALLAPIVVEGAVIGVLASYSARPHRHNDEEKRLLGALANLGAVAIANARLYARVFQSEDTLRKNETLTTLGLLAAEIAHEVRNPLTVIKLLYSSLRIEFAAGDPRIKDMRIIGEKLNQLEATVTRVLNLAKAPGALHSRWPLDEIITDTLLLVRLKLHQGMIAVRYEPAPETLFVEVNKGQIQQVLLNLILNSTHAMPAGGCITLRAARGPRADGAPGLVLDFSDTGRGIPAELQPKLFASVLMGRTDGTGLGLAIVKRILQSHHGDIELLATGPAGTTFRITLPLAP